MSDEDTRFKRSQSRKKNIYAKLLFDPNEFKGAFSSKIVEEKNRYKRERFKPHTIRIEEDVDEQ